MATRAAAAAALLIGLSLVPLAPAARPLTADQRVATGLTDALSASKASLAKLSHPSAEKTPDARAGLGAALTALEGATKFAPTAVGALDVPSIRNGLRDAAILLRKARVDVANKHHANARAKIRKAIALATAARAAFGVPLSKDFTSFVVNQNVKNVPGFEAYSALTATVGTYVDEIVIGAANRETANVGERGAKLLASKQLPITQMSQRMIIEPNGEFAGGWCDLAGGLITCPLDQPMRSDQRFTIAFGPKLPRGTKLLVKFHGQDDRRSYFVLSTR